MKDCLEISLLDLRFHSRHGVFPQENTVGNEFSVDVSVTVPRDLVSGDEISTTVSYADIYGIVKEEMSIPRKLMETIAVAIAGRLQSNWHEIKGGSISITKINPPIAGITGSARVRYDF